MLLEVNNVYFNIGSKKIINGISLNFDKGKVLGILGPNGNGKTTLLNLIYGFYKCNNGEIKIDGNKVSSKTKNLVSFMQDNTNFPKSMKIKDAVSFYKDFFDDFNINEFDKLIKEMKLDYNMKIRDLSKGMKEKLCLILTLSKRSKLYMLDEPIGGVDPVARETIINTIIKSINEESSLIVTTHNVGEMENIFDEVVFINEGEIIESGDAEELRIKYGMSIDGIYRKLFG